MCIMPKEVTVEVTTTAPSVEQEFTFTTEVEVAMPSPVRLPAFPLPASARLFCGGADWRRVASH